MNNMYYFNEYSSFVFGHDNKFVYIKYHELGKACRWRIYKENFDKFVCTENLNDINIHIARDELERILLIILDKQMYHPYIENAEDMIYNYNIF